MLGRGREDSRKEGKEERRERCLTTRDIGVIMPGRGRGGRKREGRAV